MCVGVRPPTASFILKDICNKSCLFQSVDHSSKWKSCLKTIKVTQKIKLITCLSQLNIKYIYAVMFNLSGNFKPDVIRCVTQSQHSDQTVGTLSKPFEKQSYTTSHDGAECLNTFLNEHS